MSPKDLTGMRYRGEESLPEHSRCNATSSEALEAPDTQRVIEAFKDMPGRELVEMIGHARRLEKRLRRVAHNIVGPYVGIEEHSERVANALTELDRLQQSAQSENTTTTEARAGLSQGAPISGSTPDASALSATRCTACGAKEGEPCRGNCERAMPSSIGESGAAEYELLDAAVAFIERNAASVFALEGFDRLSMAIHNHPGAHIKVEDRASRSATGAIRLADYINAADILASDAPHVVVEKLQAAVDRNAKNPRRYQARRVSP
jgi:hypothetical protein